MKELPFRNYQRYCLSYIRRRKGHALLALDMGLGKTLIALAYANTYDKIIIMCPASVKYQWAAEIEKWFGKQTVCILSGKKLKSKISKAKYYIINYDILIAWKKELLSLKSDVLILDECHLLKTSGSKRTKAAVSISKQIQNIIGLSGTPMINRPIELFPVLKIINKTIFPNYFKYGQRYCYRKSFFAPCGFDYRGAHYVEELNKILKAKVMVRMCKEEVLGELPDTIQTVIPLEINMAEYNQVRDDLVTWLKERNKKTDNLLAMNKMEYLKQVSAKEKLPEIYRWIDNFLTTGKKLTLFATHKAIIQELMDRYKDSIIKIDGSTPVKNRRVIVKRFQTDGKIQILIGNTKAMGVGIDGIQEVCSDVCFLELPWTWADVSQAFSRLHRMGQKSTVNIYFFIAKSTIDEYIFKLISEKKELFNGIIDGKEVNEESVFAKLLLNL